MTVPSVSERPEIAFLALSHSKNRNILSFPLNSERSYTAENLLLSSKLLVVEDIQDTRELLHLYFTNAGFAVSIASDGLEGLCLTKVEKPDAIITDLAMPRLDGMEMIKRLRKDPDTANIPVIVFTAHGSVTPEEAQESGAEAIFYKPFDFDELVKIVKLMVQQNDNSLGAQSGPRPK